MYLTFRRIIAGTYILCGVFAVLLWSFAVLVSMQKWESHNHTVSILTGLMVPGILLSLAGILFWLENRLGTYTALLFPLCLWATSSTVPHQFKESDWVYFIDAYKKSAAFCSWSLILIIPLCIYLALSFRRKRLEQH